MSFCYADFLPEEMYYKINEIKTFHPELIISEMENRDRPAYCHKRMVFAAADHNARMIQAYKGNALGLSNRREYLARLVRILLSDEVDGIESVPDIIEDLFVINYLVKEKHGIDFLKNKQIIGTVNRGGLSGVVWEMDDMCTCYTVEKIAKMHLDGIKFMLRINPDSMENRNTLSYCAAVINKAEEYGLPVYIEGLFIGTQDGKYVMKTDLESLVKTVGVVSALGCTSVGKWIELPLNESYKTAVSASTCSFLVVPDEIGMESREIVEEYTKECHVADNVRGILLGRNVLYSQEDPYILAEAIANCWHRDWTIEKAYEMAKNSSTIFCLA